MSFQLVNDAFSNNCALRAAPSNQAFPTENGTIIWACYHDALTQVAQFVTFFTVGMDSFIGNDDYFVAFAGTDALPNRNFAIGSQGNDTYGAAGPVTGRWYYQAYRRRKRATNDYEQLFYYDLPDLTKVVSRDVTVAANLASNTNFTFGSSFWVGGNEGVQGRMCNLKIFKSALPQQGIIQEAKSWQLMNGIYRSALWGQYPCRNAADIRDVSGNGRHLTWHIDSTAAVTIAQAPSLISWREPVGRYAFDAVILSSNVPPVVGRSRTMAMSQRAG
jgi:hypothetical protein